MKRFSISIIYLLSFYGALWSESVLSGYVNQYRTSRGLSALAKESILEETAMQYCRVLINEGKLSHRDSRGDRVLDRYRENGGTAARAGEILGTSTDPQSIFQAWRESESHNDLMLNARWTRVGEALLEEQGQYVAVVLFSDSLIDSYEAEETEARLSLSIRSLKGASISTRGKASDEKGEITIEFHKEELPVLLIITGEKEGKKWSSDFLYLSEKILDQTH